MSSFYHVYLEPRTGVNRDDVEKKLSLSLDWFRYDDKNWIVYTSSDSKKLYSRLMSFLEPGGNVLIIKLDTSDYWGFMTKQLWEWMEKVR